GEIRDVPLYRAMAPVNVRRGSGVLRADGPHEEESNEPDTPGDAGEPAGGLVSRHSRRVRARRRTGPPGVGLLSLRPGLDRGKDRQASHPPGPDRSARRRLGRAADTKEARALRGAESPARHPG